MANPNLLDPSVRKNIIDEIKSFENVERKRKSFKAYEVFNDNAKPYIVDELERQLKPSTVKKIPIVSDINFAKAIVNKQANIYTDEPVRSYEEITESDAEALENLYGDSGFDTILGKSNKYFKLSNQAFLQIVPKEQKLKLRVLHAHNVDVIPDVDDPEKAYAFIVSSFDKTQYLNAKSDNSNQKIAEADDYKANAERFQVWTSEYVFTMDGNGNVLTEIIPNTIEMLPFVDIAKDKDFEYFIRTGHALTEFSIYLNTLWSDLFYIQRMQGYSVPVLSGDANLKPDNLNVGPGDAVFLPSNPNKPESNLTLEFKNPNPNIDSNIKAIEAATATFLSTRGLDTKAISASNSGAVSYSSALERLLAMLDQFKASKEDFDLYKMVEQKIHTIVTKYLSILSGTEFLDPKYSTTSGITNSVLNITFVEPQMIETTSEKLTNAKSRIDIGISDKVTVLSEIDNISIEEAQNKLSEIQQRKLDSMTSLMGGGDAAKSALNGAQVSSLVEIVSKVAAGLLPYDSAVNMIMREFNVIEEEAEEMLGPAGKSFKIDPNQIGNNNGGF